jgi:hypothetical protein
VKSRRASAERENIFLFIKEGRKTSQEVLRPFDGICVEVVGVRGSSHRPPAVRLPHSVQPRQWAPVQRSSNVVDAPAKTVSVSYGIAKCVGCLAYCAGYVGPLPRASMMSISPEMKQALRHIRNSGLKDHSGSPLRGQGPYVLSSGSIQMAGHSYIKDKQKKLRRTAISRKHMMGTTNPVPKKSNKAVSSESDCQERKAPRLDRHLPSWQLGSHLDFSITDATFAFCRDAGAHDRIDDGA